MFLLLPKAHAGAWQPADQPDSSLPPGRLLQAHHPSSAGGALTRVGACRSCT